MKKRSLLIFGLSIGGSLLFPSLVSADNCSAFYDCFNTAKVAAAAATAAAILAAILSAAADLTPGVGEAKAGAQLITGEDPFTHERVPRWQSAIGLIPVFGRVAARGLRYGMAAAKVAEMGGTARALRTAAKGLGRGVDVYEKVREPYDKFSTARDAAQSIAGHLQDYMKQGGSGSDGPRYVGTTVRLPSGSSDVGASRTYEARMIPFDQFLQIVRKGFEPVPADAPASVAYDTLKDLAKTFGKDSQTLKNVVKVEGKLGNLTKEATMNDVLDKLKD